MKLCVQKDGKLHLINLQMLRTQINRIETIMIGVAGTLIVGGITTIGTILSMHPSNGENMIKGYETKDVKASKTKESR